MTSKTVRAALRFAKELQAWTDDHINVERMLTTPLAHLKEYSTGAPVDERDVVDAFRAVGKFRASSAVAAQLVCGNGDEEMIEASFLDAAYLSLRMGLLRRNNARRTISLADDAALLIMRAISLGQITIAAKLADAVTTLKERALIGYEESRLLPLAVLLSKEEPVLRLKEPYEEAELLLTSCDDRLFYSAMSKWLDFHVARARESTNRDTFEFSSQVYRFYPVEVFAMARKVNLLDSLLQRGGHDLLSLGTARRIDSPMFGVWDGVAAQAYKRLSSEIGGGCVIVELISTT